MKQVWKAAPMDRASCTRRVPSSVQRPWACRWRRRRSLAASLICGLAGLVTSLSNVLLGPFTHTWHGLAAPGGDGSASLQVLNFRNRRLRFAGGAYLTWATDEPTAGIRSDSAPRCCCCHRRGREGRANLRRAILLQREASPDCRRISQHRQSPPPTWLRRQTRYPRASSVPDDTEGVETLVCSARLRGDIRDCRLRSWAKPSQAMERRRATAPGPATTQVFRSDGRVIKNTLQYNPNSD